ncbi:MAG: hypothetical protein OHK0056_28680 [Bacteriovoracaceae bacterium]
MKTAFFLALSLLVGNAYATDCQLSKKQVKALKNAQEIDRFGLNRNLLGKDIYKVEALKDEKRNKTVVFLGETHVKGPRSAIIGKQVVKAFKFRMLEGIPKAEADFIAQNDPELDAVLGWQRALLQGLTFNFFGSTITVAQKNGLAFLPGYNAILLDKDVIAKADTNTAEEILELLPKYKGMTNEGINLPLEVGEFLTPSSDNSYILEARNLRMAKNIVTYLDDSSVDANSAVVIVGSDHNKGLVELLAKEGFKKCQF